MVACLFCFFYTACCFGYGLTCLFTWRFFFLYTASTEHAIAVADQVCEHHDEVGEQFSSSSTSLGGESFACSTNLLQLDEIRKDGEQAVHFFQSQTKELVASFLSSAEGLVERYTLDGHRATARALMLCDKLGRENEVLRVQLEGKKTELLQAEAALAASGAFDNKRSSSPPRAKRLKANHPESVKTFHMKAKGKGRAADDEK